MTIPNVCYLLQVRWVAAKHNMTSDYIDQQETFMLLREG